jgi:hypothetical protein
MWRFENFFLFAVNSPDVQSFLFIFIRYRYPIEIYAKERHKLFNKLYPFEFI